MEKLRRAVSDDGNPEDLFLTWAGTETVLLYDLKFPLREFAAFEVALDPCWQTKFNSEFFDRIADLAIKAQLPVIMDATTWRASPDYLAKLGYQDGDLKRVNEAAVEAQKSILDRFKPQGLVGILSAEIGPRGDGYVPTNAMDPTNALQYHLPQIRTLSECGVDMVSAYTMTHAGEAAGIALAAGTVGIPVAISATVETDGKLPDGTHFGSFVEEVDKVCEDNGQELPLYYLINCAHPTHFEQMLDAALAENASWVKRLKGVRANASTLSHAELDEMETCDSGNPNNLGQELMKLHSKGICILGGCCGTDVQHIEQMLVQMGKVQTTPAIRAEAAEDTSRQICGV